MQSTQFGRVILGTFLVGTALMLLSYFLRFKQKSNRQLFLHILVSVILLVMFVLSYDLTIEVDEKDFSFNFGPGVIEKTFPIEQIESCESVENKRWYGYGVRWLQDARLYNVSGLEAVEIKLKNEDRKLRVGTNNPDQVCEWIEEVSMIK